MFVNKVHKKNFIIIAMAGKQIIPKGFRVSTKADEILKEISKRDFRDFPTVVRLALLEYAHKHHPDLYDSLALELTPQ